MAFWLVPSFFQAAKMFNPSALLCQPLATLCFNLYRISVISLHWSDDLAGCGVRTL